MKRIIINEDDNKSYEIQEALSPGANGLVYLATDLNESKKVVLKKVAESTATSEVDPILLEHYKLLHTSHIIHINEVFVKDGYYYIVSDYFGTNLQTHRENMSSLEDLTCGLLVQLIFQCVNGLSYLHERNLVHRDIKTMNIFVDYFHEADQMINIVIGDLGCIRECKGDNSEDSQCGEEDLDASNPQHNFLVNNSMVELEGSSVYNGTPGFMSPELVEDNLLSVKSDIWSLGVTLLVFIFNDLAILKLEPSLMSLPETVDNLFSKYSPSFDKREIAGMMFIMELIKKMLTRNHLQRIDCRGIIEFLTENLKRDYISSMDKLSDLYDYLKPILKENYSLTKCVLFTSGFLFERIPEHLQKEKELALVALTTEPYMYDIFCYELKMDPDIIFCYAKYSNTSIEAIPEYLASDKDFITKTAYYNASILQYASSDLQDDEEVVTTACCAKYGFSGHALKYASERLKNNKEVVRKAINHNEYAFVYASDELKDDKEMVELALSKNGLSIQYCSERFQNNVEYVLKAMDQNPSAFLYSGEYGDDDFIVNKAVNQDGSLLKYVSDRLRNDKLTVLSAIANNVIAYNYASIELQNDFEVCLAAYIKDRTCLLPDQYQSMIENYISLENQGYSLITETEIELPSINMQECTVFSKEQALYILSPSRMLNFSEETLCSIAKYHRHDRDVAVALLRIGRIHYVDDMFKREDRDFILLAVQLSGKNLRFASDIFKNEEIIAEYALRNTSESFSFVSFELKDNKQFIQKLLDNDLLKDIQNYNQISERLKEDQDIIQKVLEKDGLFLQFVSQKLKNQKEIIQMAIESDGMAIQFLNEEQLDFDIVLSAIQSNANSLKFVPDNWKKNREIVTKAISKKGSVIRYVPYFDNDPDMIELAVIKDYSAFAFASTILRSNREFIFKLLRKGVDIRIFQYFTDEKLILDKQILIFLCNSSISEFSIIVQSIKDYYSNDFDIMLVTLRNNPSFLDLVDQQLILQKQFLISAVKQNKEVFDLLDRSLVDKDIICSVLSSNGELYQELDSELLSDKDIAKSAVISYPFSITHLPNDLINDRSFIKECVKASPSCSMLLDEIDKEIVLLAVSNNGHLIESFPDYLDDRDVILAAVKQEGFALKSIQNESFLDDEEIVLAAVKNQGKPKPQPKAYESFFSFDPVPIYYASKRLQDDKDFVLKVMDLNPLSFPYISKRLQNDLDVVLKGLSKNVAVLIWIDGSIRSNENVIKLLAKKHLESKLKELAKNSKQFFSDISVLFPTYEFTIVYPPFLEKSSSILSSMGSNPCFFNSLNLLSQPLSFNYL